MGDITIDFVQMLPYNLQSVTCQEKSWRDQLNIETNETNDTPPTKRRSYTSSNSPITHTMYKQKLAYGRECPLLRNVVLG